MICPHDGCDYESSENGVKRHYGAAHEGSIARVSRICKNPDCDKQFEAYQSRVDNGRDAYCSDECKYDDIQSYIISGEDHVQYDASTHVDKVCKWCETPMSVPQSRLEEGRGVFCSEECHNDWRSEVVSGENHPRYVDGEQRDYGRNWDRKKSQAHRRAQSRCEHPDCDKTSADVGKSLDVHHIVPFRLHDTYKEANTLDNLIVLCREHHQELEPAIELTV